MRGGSAVPSCALVERGAAIPEDSIRSIDAFHLPAHLAMVCVGLAPCLPFSVSRDLMGDAALRTRDKGVVLHTHLAGNDANVAYSDALFELPPWVRHYAGPLYAGGIRVGLGVDGSASNYAGNLVAKGADKWTARGALEIATPGGTDAGARSFLSKVAWS